MRLHCINHRPLLNSCVFAATLELETPRFVPAMAKSVEAALRCSDAAAAARTPPNPDQAAKERAVRRNVVMQQVREKAPALGKRKLEAETEERQKTKSKFPDENMTLMELTMTGMRRAISKQKPKPALQTAGNGAAGSTATLNWTSSAGEKQVVPAPVTPPDILKSGVADSHGPPA